MDKLKVFVDETIRKFTDAVNVEIEDYISANAHKFHDPVLCLMAPRVEDMGAGRIQILARYKIMERDELPPVVVVGDD